MFPKSASGAALPEFAIILPFLVLVVAGVFELGRGINQLSWLSQTGFEMARAGSMTVGAAGQARMHQIGNLYYSKLNRDLAGGADGFASSTYTEDGNFVKVNIADQVDLLFGGIPVPIAMAFTGSVLSKPFEGTPDDFGDSSESYDCLGEICSEGSCPDEPCCLEDACGEHVGNGGRYFKGIVISSDYHYFNKILDIEFGGTGIH